MKNMLEPTDNDVKSMEQDLENDYDPDDDSCLSPPFSTQVSKSSVDEGYRYEVLSTDKLVEKMEAYIQEINSMMEPPIPKSTAMALLNHLKWDKTRFLEQYFDDCDRLFKEAKISRPKTTKEKQKNNILKKLKSVDEILCEICFTSQRKSSNTGLEECGHVYCNDCWRGYLNSKVSKFCTPFTT